MEQLYKIAYPIHEQIFELGKLKNWDWKIISEASILRFDFENLPVISFSGPTTIVETQIRREFFEKIWFFSLETDMYLEKILQLIVSDFLYDYFLE